MSDDERNYRPTHELEDDAKRDPIVVLRQRLIDECDRLVDVALVGTYGVVSYTVAAPIWKTSGCCSTAFTGTPRAAR